MFIKRHENDKLNYVVNNNSSLIKSFLNQTKSNFNNKYKVIYSISDWRQKSKVKTLLNTIKSYQYKNNFSDYLTNKLHKKPFQMKITKKKNIIKKVETSKIALYNISKDYFQNIFHKNNLIKVKTMNDIKYKPNQLRKNNTDIFDKNNTFFRTMPINKLKKPDKNTFNFL